MEVWGWSSSGGSGGTKPRRLPRRLSTLLSLPAESYFRFLVRIPDFNPQPQACDAKRGVGRSRGVKAKSLFSGLMVSSGRFRREEFRSEGLGWRV